MFIYLRAYKMTDSFVQHLRDCWVKMGTILWIMSDPKMIMKMRVAIRRRQKGQTPLNDPKQIEQIYTRTLASPL